MSNADAKMPVGQKCGKCGFKVRTKEHEEGQHHKKGTKGKMPIVKRR